MLYSVVRYKSDYEIDYEIDYESFVIVIMSYYELL